jgi:signal transduction histidine kinase
MLFLDLSCDSDRTIERQYGHRVHEFLGSDWFGIISLSKRGSVRIETRYDVSGIGDERVLEFVEAYQKELQHQEYKYKTFERGNVHFMVFPVRENEHGYLIFFVHCRLAGPFEGKDIEWYQLYSDVAYNRVLLNNELIQEQNFLDQVMEGTESVIAVIDGSYDVLTANDAAANLLANNLKDVKFSNMSGKRTMLGLIDEVLASETRRKVSNIVIVQGDRRYILDVVLSPLCNSKDVVSGVVMVGNDITEKRRMEFEAEQLKHYGLLSEISLGLARDVKTPLMNIRSCAGLLKKRGTFEGGGEEMLDLIVDEVKRISDIINQMQSYSNVGRQDGNSMTNVNEVLENCIQIVKRQMAWRKVAVNYRPGIDIPLIKAENKDLQQIFVNILLNALQAIEENGTIGIATRYDEEQGRVLVVVEDDGVGIDEVDKEQLFSPYYTTKAHGTGLGLFMIKGTVEKYRGTIQLESVENKGTTCSVALPCGER